MLHAGMYTTHGNSVTASSILLWSSCKNVPLFTVYEISHMGHEHMWLTVQLNLNFTHVLVHAHMCLQVYHV